MGLFNIFKKETNKTTNNNINKELPFDITYTVLPNGNYKVELKDNSYVENSYDTTRLLISKNPLKLANRAVYNCAVSWYNSNHTEFYNNETGKFENVSAESYRGVLAELDLHLLQTDKKYCYLLMKRLLDKERVERYLADGLKDVPEMPCGKYIGGIQKIDNQYQKFFSQDVGLASHESDLMKNRRKELKEKLNKEREEKIAIKRAQMATLQSEIDDLEK